MQILEQKNDSEILASLLAEVAKSTAEIRCAQNDLAKAQSRLGFALAAINQMISRKGDR